MSSANIKKLFEKELKNKLALKSSGHTTEETVLLKAFKYFDLDNSGLCNITEFLRAISKIGITGFTDENLVEIFKIYDVDKSGELDYKEFVGGLFGNESIINERRNKPQIQKTQPQPQPQEVSKQEYINSDEVDNILLKIRNRLASRGVRGIISVAKNFAIIDDDGSHMIDFNEFKKACKDFRFGLTEDEIQKVFVAFDRDGSGNVDYDEFLRTVRGKMTDARRELVEKAFGVLDKNKNGVVELEDIKQIYDASKHPDVVSGKKSEDDVLFEFLETFETTHNILNGSENDGKVTLEEFIEYYENVAMSIDDDEYFKVMMENAWKFDQKEDVNNKKGWSNVNKEEPTVADNYNKNVLPKKKAEPQQQEEQNVPNQPNQEVPQNIPPQGEQVEEVKPRKVGRMLGEKNAKVGTYENAPYANEKNYEQVDPYKKQGRTLGERNAKVGTFQNAPFGVDNEPVNYCTSNNPQGRSKNAGSNMQLDMSKKGPEVINKFREVLASRGIRGIMSVRRVFMIADDDNSKTIDINELAKFCYDYRMELNDNEIEELFQIFDRDKSGHIDYDEFLAGIVGEMNDFRVALVKKVFNKLDKNHNGFVEVDDIRDLYSAKNHPDVLSGKKTESEVLGEWLDTFEYHFNLLNTNKTDDQKVSLEEFISYYNNISMSIPDDQYFEVMISNAWNLYNQPNFGRGWKGEI